MLKSILAIALGAALGALLRAALGARFNGVFRTIPPGTLVANLVGAYRIGLALAFFAYNPDISPEWRLLITTCFLRRPDHVFHLFRGSRHPAPARQAKLGTGFDCPACQRFAVDDRGRAGQRAMA